MRATTDALDTVEFPESVNSPRSSAPVSIPGIGAPRALRKKPQEKWISSLSPQDLRCLLAVLETQLIPRLVDGYSPAAHAPRSPDSRGG